MFDATKAKLLLLEPEPILADLVSFRLELLGYQVTVVPTGVQAIDRLRKGEFDLLIVDTQLLEGDGLEWIKKTRLEFKSDQVPVLVLSLDPSLETARRAFVCGANDYLITPFDPTVLESKIQNLVTRAVIGKSS